MNRKICSEGEDTCSNLTLTTTSWGDLRQVSISHPVPSPIPLITYCRSYRPLEFMFMLLLLLHVDFCVLVLFYVLLSWGMWKLEVINK